MSSFRVIRETFSNRNLAVLTITQTLFLFTAFLWWPYRSLFILKLGASVGGLPFQPLVDGELLPEPPLDAIRAGRVES